MAAAIPDTVTAAPSTKPAGRLEATELEGPAAGVMPFQAVYPAVQLPGPAGRWLLEWFAQSSLRLRGPRVEWLGRTASCPGSPKRCRTMNDKLLEMKVFVWIVDKGSLTDA